MPFLKNPTMLRKNIFHNLVFILLTVLCHSAKAEQTYELNALKSGSYKQILAGNANHSFILVVWSIDCTSCLKDMELLSHIHNNRPELKIIMLAADDLSATGKIQEILQKNRLSDIEHWVFAEENTQKLRFEIDPKWYGEIPRTYFFDKAHRRTGVSGVLSKEDYDAKIAKILK
jgi:hypothetical protein